MNIDLNCALSEKNGISSVLPSSNETSNADTKSSNSDNLANTTSSHDTQSIRPSTALRGKLVARVLPQSYGEYNTRQSGMSRVDDPTEWVQCLDNSKAKDHGVGSDTTKFDSTENIGELQTIESIHSTEENVVALDIHFIRMKHPNSDDRTLSNRVDNNHSTHSKENVLHLRMNRSSKELASRTLRRLEVSTVKKMKGILPIDSKRNTDGSTHLGQTFCKLVHVGECEDVTRSGREVETDSVDACNSECRQCVPIDISEWSSEDMWNECAIQGNDDYKIVLAVPSSIIPRIKSSCQSSTSAYECVEVDIISNPPTLLSLETFENFTSHIFTGVPIVLRTTIIYATHATITWFANNEVVRQDSHVYTPTVHDVGKRLTVLITPLRLNHSGEGCQEAYSFSRLVEVLPTMPIVELRENWIHRKCESSTGTTTSRLRVLTVSFGMSYISFESA